MLLLHVRFAREDAAKRGATLAVPELADFLRRLGYSVKLRTALGGGPGGACLRTLRHTFLTVSVEGPSGSMQYVLDPRFRDQVRSRHGQQARAAGTGSRHSIAECAIGWQAGWLAGWLREVIVQVGGQQLQKHQKHQPLTPPRLSSCLVLTARSLRLRTPRGATAGC
jgi:hypothetical protein